MKRNFGVIEELGVAAESFTLPFPLQEYRNRLIKIRMEMEKRGIDLLYLTSPESMYYVSGLNMVWYATNSSSLWDGTKNMGIAVSVDHDDFILFQTSIEEDLIKAATCAKDARIYGEADGTYINGKKYEGPKEGEDLTDLVIRDLKNEKWLKGTVALELGSSRPPARVSMAFQEKLKAEGCSVVDGTDIVAKIRKIKSPMELNYIRKAAAIADIGMEAIVNEFTPGMTELDIVGIFTKAMMSAGGETVAIAEMVRSGEGKIWCGHSPASRRVIMPGEPIAVDFAGVYNRYHADLGRFFCRREPDPDYAKEYYKGNVEVMAEVKRIMKPGITVGAFSEELIKFYKEFGMWDSQCYSGGYEMGIAFPPDWCGEFVFDITMKDNWDHVFEPGMVINFETGMGVIDTVIFTEEKADFLGKTTYDLIILD